MKLNGALLLFVQYSKWQSSKRGPSQTVINAMKVSYHPMIGPLRILATVNTLLKPTPLTPALNV